MTRDEVQNSIWNRLEEICGPVPPQDFEEQMAWRRHWVNLASDALCRGDCLFLRLRRESPIGWEIWSIENKVAPPSFLL